MGCYLKFSLILNSVFNLVLEVGVLSWCWISGLPFLHFEIYALIRSSSVAKSKKLTAWPIQMWRLSSIIEIQMAVLLHPHSLLTKLWITGDQVVCLLSQGGCEILMAAWVEC